MTFSFRYYKQKQHIYKAILSAPSFFIRMNDGQEQKRTKRLRP